MHCPLKFVCCITIKHKFYCHDIYGLEKIDVFLTETTKNKYNKVQRKFLYKNPSLLLHPEQADKHV